MTAFLKRLEWLLTGEVDGGVCPECEHDTINIDESGYECTHCGFEGDLPKVPGWF